MSLFKIKLVLLDEGEKNFLEIVRHLLQYSVAWEEEPTNIMGFHKHNGGGSDS